MAYIDTSRSAEDSKAVVITFHYSEDEAPVWITTSFNDWQPIQMAKSESHKGDDHLYEHTFMVPKDVNSILYKFRIGDNEWVSDTNAPAVHDGFGGMNNRFDVPDLPHLGSKPTNEDAGEVEQEGGPVKESEPEPAAEAKSEEVAAPKAKTEKTEAEPEAEPEPVKESEPEPVTEPKGTESAGEEPQTNGHVVRDEHPQPDEVLASMPEGIPKSTVRPDPDEARTKQAVEPQRQEQAEPNSQVEPEDTKPDEVHSSVPEGIPAETVASLPAKDGGALGKFTEDEMEGEAIAKPEEPSSDTAEHTIDEHKAAERDAETDSAVEQTPAAVEQFQAKETPVEGHDRPTKEPEPSNHEVAAEPDSDPAPTSIKDQEIESDEGFHEGGSEAEPVVFEKPQPEPEPSVSKEPELVVQPQISNDSEPPPKTAPAEPEPVAPPADSVEPEPEQEPTAAKEPEAEAEVVSSEEPKAEAEEEAPLAKEPQAEPEREVATDEEPQDELETEPPPAKEPEPASTGPESSTRELVSEPEAEAVPAVAAPKEPERDAENLEAEGVPSDLHPTEETEKGFSYSMYLGIAAVAVAIFAILFAAKANR